MKVEWIVRLFKALGEGWEIWGLIKEKGMTTMWQEHMQALWATLCQVHMQGRSLKAGVCPRLGTSIATQKGRRAREFGGNEDRRGSSESWRGDLMCLDDMGNLWVRELWGAKSNCNLGSLWPGVYLFPEVGRWSLGGMQNEYALNS